MIALIQRVTRASVSIPRQTRSIGPGYLVLLGVDRLDTSSDVRLLAAKTAALRLMSDQHQKMNLSLSAVHGEILVISQFTLLGDVSKGNRPSFVKAATPAIAQKLYQEYVTALKNTGLKVKTGFFGEYMGIDLLNDGPVTLILDSKQLTK